MFVRYSLSQEVQIYLIYIYIYISIVPSNYAHDYTCLSVFPCTCRQNDPANSSPFWHTYTMRLLLRQDFCIWNMHRAPIFFLDDDRHTKLSWVWKVSLISNEIFCLVRNMMNLTQNDGNIGLMPCMFYRASLFFGNPKISAEMQIVWTCRYRSCSGCWNPTWRVVEHKLLKMPTFKLWRKICWRPPVSHGCELGGKVERLFRDSRWCDSSIFLNLSD